MTKKASVFARVEPEIKEKAEIVLNKLGIPMSNAINIFLRQVIIQKGLPFEVKVAQNKPLVYGSLTREEFDREIKKGLNDLATGNIATAESVAERMEQELDKKL